MAFARHVKTNRVSQYVLLKFIGGLKIKSLFSMKIVWNAEPVKLPAILGVKAQLLGTRLKVDLGLSFATGKLKGKILL